MFRFAIEKPVIVSVAILILCFLGVLAVFRVPIQMIPDVEARVLTVQTVWPGATPQDIEKEVLIPGGVRAAVEVFGPDGNQSLIEQGITLACHLDEATNVPITSLLGFSA